MSRAGMPTAEVPSALTRLLSTEARLEAMVAEARERADAMVRDAELRCSARLAAVDAELRDALEAAQGRHADECAARIAALEQGTKAATSRYEAAAAGQVESLAHWVASQVLQDVAGGSGS